MSLDKAYFAGISPETVRGRFYRKSEIDAVLKEIAARVEQQSTENELLSMKLAMAQNALRDQTEGLNEVAQAIITDAKAESERIIAGAKSEAEEIIEEAREKSRGIIEATMRQQELAAAKIEESYSAMKAQHEECIGSIRAAWQEFLCGLDTEENEFQNEEVPSDLSERVSAIADALKDL